MTRRFIAPALLLIVLASPAMAGWYRVENFTGAIGSNPVHFSIQNYDSFGSGITVEGSYYDDRKNIPVPVYGKYDGGKLDLCEISDDADFQKVLVIGSKTSIESKGCAFSLDLRETGATGMWRNGGRTYPVTLSKVAALDDTGDGKVEGRVEIPFWAQTSRHMFIGLYTKSSDSVCMTSLRVVNKKSKAVDQTITFNEDGCDAGMLMTAIYENVEKTTEGGRDIISVNIRDGGMGSAVDYVFDAKANRYSKRH